MVLGTLPIYETTQAILYEGGVWSTSVTWGLCLQDFWEGLSSEDLPDLSVASTA
jgi:hypothetical protein